MPYRNPQNNIINPLKNRFIKPKQTPIPFTEGNDMMGFFDGWLNSSEYRNRIETNGYDNPEEIITNRKQALDNLKLTFDSTKRSEANAPALTGNPSYVNINKQELNKLNIPISTGLAHELSHVIGAKTNGQNNVIGFNQTERDKLTGAVTKQRPVISGPQGSPEYQQTNKEFDNWKYLLKPEEIKADLDASRWNMFNKNIYDIREGQPFTKEHLEQAKPTLQDDESFNRLLQQVGDDNYIELMNTIAMNKDNKNTVAKFGGLFKTGASGANPFAMGAGALTGFIPTENKDGMTSIGGSTVKGALSMAATGAQVAGPWGAAAGALIGGATSLIGAKKEQAEQMEQLNQRNNQESQARLASLNYGIGQSSTLPMAMGGELSSNPESMVGSFNTFDAGGTHEQSPHGGIPLGQNNQGGMNLVEQDESAFKFEDGKYIFSKRLTY